KADGSLFCQVLKAIFARKYTLPVTPTPHSTPADASIVPIAAPRNRPRAMREPLVCFSHLRWDFVFQRPQHLMTRFARTRDVIVFEEPERAEPDRGPSLDVSPRDDGVTVATPRLPDGLEGWGKDVILRQLLDDLMLAR